MPVDWGLIHGRPEPPSAVRSMSAADLSAGVVGGDVIRIAHRGRELLALVGVRVRDPEWHTIPACCGDLQVERDGAATIARTRASHHGRGIAYSCAISIGLRGHALSYEMDGVAESEFDYARIGIVALHPSAVTAGRRFRADGPRGPTKGVLPTLVGPQRVIDGEIQPLFPAFRRLEIAVDSGLTVAFELDGDEFEMEDQRNWTDGSFKTYSTPVGSALPHHARSGTRFRQRLRIEVRAARTVRAAEETRAAGRRTPVRAPGPREMSVSPGAGEVTMPSLGTTWQPDDGISGLQALRPGHLRVELVDERAIGSLAQEALAAAAAAGAELEIALCLPRSEADASRHLSALAEIIGRADSPPARVAVSREGEEVTTPVTVQLVRERLPAVAILAGSARNFAELNRSLSTVGTAAVDGLFFAANPQMHDSDERSIMLSLSGQHDAVATARTLTGCRPVHVSPITLLPRTATEPDPRQRSLFAAAWLAGSAAALTAAGAASASWFRLVGPRGLMSEPGGDRYPAFHVLRELCAWRGRRLLTVTTNDPDTCAGLAAEHDGELRVLLANLTADPIALDVTGIASDAQVGCVGLVAGSADEPFAASERAEAVGASGMRVELGRYTVARIRGSSRDVH